MRAPLRYSLRCARHERRLVVASASRLTSRRCERSVESPPATLRCRRHAPPRCTRSLCTLRFVSIAELSQSLLGVTSRYCIQIAALANEALTVRTETQRNFFVCRSNDASTSIWVRSISGGRGARVVALRLPSLGAFALRQSRSVMCYSSRKIFIYICVFLFYSVGNESIAS